MDVLDYARSFAFNTAAIDGEEVNTCRTQILARCTVSNGRTGEEGDFFLGKECIGEAMFKEAGIAQLPTAEVCIVFSEGQSVLLKKFVDHRNDVVQVGDMATRRPGHDGSYSYWTDVRFDLAAAKARRLGGIDEITAATLQSEAMTGRTTMQSEDGSWRAVIEYPIPYMNVHPPAGRFQVDVGPVLFPDFESDDSELVSKLSLSYVMFNELDKAEFVVRTPTLVSKGSDAQTLHYSEVRKASVVNELFSIAGDLAPGPL